MEISGDGAAETASASAAVDAGATAPPTSAAAESEDKQPPQSSGYEVGEFVYIKNEGGLKPSICLLTRLYTHEDGTPMFEGVR